jgi:predicted protein tyrosine phosphatase
MNVLFICSANKLRSKTADDYFSLKYPAINFQSAGTNYKTCIKEGTTLLEEWMMDWADVVYVMENKHKNEIMKHVGSKYHKKIIILNIPDNYKYYQKELIQLFESKIKFE